MRIDDSFVGLTQWDTGRKIILNSFETCDQVHFANKQLGTTIDMKTYKLKDELVANIPDELLQSSSPLMAYCYVLREDGESTTISKEFPVRPRNKPLGYIYNPDDQTRIKEFNEFVDDTIDEMTGIKNDVKAATVHQPKIQNGTWWTWDFDTNDYVDSGVEAQGPQGIQGDKGDKGDPALINDAPAVTLKGGANIEVNQAGTDIIIDNTQQIIMDFPDYVVTDKTMEDLLDSLYDNDLPTGNIYLGGITCSDLPEGLVQAELKIESIKNSDNSSVFYFTITSTDVYPYLWTGTGFHTFSGWQARPTEDEFEQYVRNSDAATNTKLGLVKVADTSGIELESDGSICVNAATEEEIGAKTETCKPIVPATLDYAVKSVTTDVLSTGEDAPVSSKTVKTELDKYVQFTDVATTGKAGIVRPSNGITIGSDGSIRISSASIASITKREESKPITAYNLNSAVKAALSDDNRISDMTDAEKANARDVIGAAGTGDIPTTVSELTDSDQYAKKSVNNNFTAPQTINGALTVNGDIVQNGAAYETHAEQLYTKNDMIITREGAVGGLGAGELTGIEAEKYDGEHSGVLAFDADGTARVGDKGDEQPLLTRAESENLSDGQVMIWDAANQRAAGSDSYVKNTDYASSEKAGVIKKGNGLNIADNGVPFASTCTAAQYQTDSASTFLSKGTLENIKDDIVRGVLPQAASTLPSTLAANTEYYLGESAAVSFAFPETGALGQYCFVKLDSGDTAATLTVTGENYVGDIPAPKANKTYEILATWNGSKWVCSYRGY